MIQIVLQGPIYPYTRDIVSSYLSVPIVHSIIVSCWDNDIPLDVSDSRVTVVRSSQPTNPGVGNRNCQIVSSRIGLESVSLDFCAKMRTDQFISPDSILMMENFFQNYRAYNSSSPFVPIFVIGMFSGFPFHPRDHVFWGHTNELRKLFDIPLDIYNGPVDYNRVTRAETYIGTYYYERFDSRVTKFRLDPDKYLVDNAPYKHEAMEVYNQIRDKVFKVFPRINMKWPKNGLPEYHCIRFLHHTEYWYEDIEEGRV